MDDEECIHGMLNGTCSICLASAPTHRQGRRRDVGHGRGRAIPGIKTLNVARHVPGDWERVVRTLVSNPGIWYSVTHTTEHPQKELRYRARYKVEVDPDRLEIRETEDGALLVRFL